MEALTVETSKRTFTYLLMTSPDRTGSRARRAARGAQPRKARSLAAQRAFASSRGRAGLAPNPPAAPAARRRRLPGAERRALVLDAAVARFAEHGFAGTPLSEVARAAGLSEAMLIKLFGSKLELFEALIERQIARTGGAALLSPERACGTDDLAFFREFAETVLRLGRAEVPFLRVLFFGALEGSELAVMFHRIRIRAIVDYVAGYVRRRVREGAFRRVDPEAAALAFLGMLSEDTFSHAFRVGEKPSHDPETLAVTFAEIMVRGLVR
ncbi:MAG: TetR/AcrR family transcriptional regulator [Deltaproteobacteria bacterium]|nr:TetR/AcrR family transcriptional regulator [Deltaproteobacteria bacterium]